MKKILITVAMIAAIVMSSCSKNEVLDPENSNLISFKTYNSQTTKVVEDVTLDQLKTNGFNVQGRLTAGGVQFMTERNATWDTSAWEYDGALMYWPVVDSIDFLAVNRDNDKVKMGEISSFIGNTTAPTVTYSQAAAVKDQKDLVIAYAPNSEKGSNGAVALKFKHALSKISATVKAQSTDTNLTLKVNSITFKKVQPKGVCTISGNTTTATSFIWVASETGADLALGLTATPVEIAGIAFPIFTDVLKATEGHAMIIPQAMTSIVIDGIWEQTVGGKTVVVDDFSGANAKTVELTGTWAANKHYTYNFTITPNVTAITFTVDEIDGWDSIASAHEIK